MSAAKEAKQQDRPLELGAFLRELEKARQGIYEVMPYTDSLQEFSDAKDDLPKLRRQAYQEGMRSLRLSGAQKVANGVATMIEVLRVAPESK